MTARPGQPWAAQRGGCCRPDRLPAEDWEDMSPEGQGTFQPAERWVRPASRRVFPGWSWVRPPVLTETNDMPVPPPSLLTGYDHNRTRTNMNLRAWRRLGGRLGTGTAFGPRPRRRARGAGTGWLIPASSGQFTSLSGRREGWHSARPRDGVGSVCGRLRPPVCSQEAPRAAGCHRASQGRQGRAPCAEGGAPSRAGGGQHETAEVRLPRAWPSGRAAVRQAGPAQGLPPFSSSLQLPPVSL